MSGFVMSLDWEKVQQYHFQGPLQNIPYGVTVLDSGMWMGESRPNELCPGQSGAFLLGEPLALLWYSWQSRETEKVKSFRSPVILDYL